MIKAVIPKSLLDDVLPYGHLVEAIIYNCAYGFPARGMKVVGITGTNGKTTTSFMVHRMLQDAGYKTGFMTTTSWGIGNEAFEQKIHMTNVAVPVLMKRLKRMKQEGVEWLVLETTSHALAQHRTWGMPYSIAVLTNITHEHLNYHRTFERYVAAKRRLFTLAQRNKRGLQVGIANADDPSGASFAAETVHSELYGLEAGGVRATDVRLHAGGIEYTAKASDETYHITSRLAGSFNVYNSLAAVCVGRAVGLNKKQIERGIAALERVEGRMTVIDEGQPYGVLVDFAHTPDSFEKLFKDLRPVVKGRMTVVFGSLGGGDRAKRPLQGELAGKYTDRVVLTEEDDRAEKWADIVADIAAGAKKAGKVQDKDLFLVQDRTEAMRFALAGAKAGDMVLFLGKGHEKTIERNDATYPWNEIETAHALVRETLGK
jgi:UDP-N-acetylmuramoyl-L-alanyl-D-glutamate--2,6-diaminopimelate ligase